MMLAEAWRGTFEHGPLRQRDRRRGQPCTWRGARRPTRGRTRTERVDRIETQGASLEEESSPSAARSLLSAKRQPSSVLDQRRSPAVNVDPRSKGGGRRRALETQGVFEKYRLSRAVSLSCLMKHFSKNKRFGSVGRKIAPHFAAGLHG